MSKIARRITGMTEKELFNCDFSSMKLGMKLFGTTHKDIRIYAGLILLPEDIERERRKLKIPKALRR